MREDQTVETAREAPTLPTPTGGEPNLGELVAQRFRIAAHLGGGGMGQVFAAEDLLLGQEIALKFFPAELARSERALGQFYAEVALARQVAHPNVCRVYDVGTCGSRRFLSMELVHGRNLAQLLEQRGRLPFEEAVNLARQLCAGLRAAHECGILHRDLKPENVLVDGSGRVRITDFGLASAVGAGDGRAAGTPAFMAPEQLVGRGASVASDVFSLGLLLYQVFTGRSLVRARNLTELVHEHETWTPPDPSAECPEMKVGLARLLRSCLAFDPARRPRSVWLVERAVTRTRLRDALAPGRLAVTLPALLLALGGFLLGLPGVPSPAGAGSVESETLRILKRLPVVAGEAGHAELSEVRVRYTAGDPWPPSVERSTSSSARSS